MISDNNPTREDAQVNTTSGNEQPAPPDEMGGGELIEGDGDSNAPDEVSSPQGDVIADDSDEGREDGADPEEDEEFPENAGD